MDIFVSDRLRIDFYILFVNNSNVTAIQQSQNRPSFIFHNICQNAVNLSKNIKEIWSRNQEIIRYEVFFFITRFFDNMILLSIIIFLYHVEVSDGGKNFSQKKLIQKKFIMTTRKDLTYFG